MLLRFASAALLAAIAGGPASAEIAVRTGEHPGFTRLVVDDPGIGSWQIGRTPEGYAIRVGPGDRFDLSGVFRSIRRDRIAAVRDEGKGVLSLRLGCACHVQPLEVRPGVIVMDIHDGPPPAGSPYERTLPLDGQPRLAGIRPRSRPGPPPAPYDWRSVPRTTPGPEITPAFPQPALEAMRQSLVEQLSRGAAAGAVEFVERPPEPAPAPEAPPATAQIQVLPTPGLDTAITERPADRLLADGSPCIEDERLDLAAWGSDKPVAEQMASALAGLSGEFDRPQPEALRTAVRYYLHLGFGAEARQLLSRFNSDDPDRPLWDSMARTLDGEAVAGEPFAGMASCDTAAALWSVLADPPSGSRSVNAAAVLRSFSALPVHLRRALGPRLIEAALARGDTAGARSLRDAMMRAPGEAGAEAALADARLDLAEGTGRPMETLSDLSAGSGPASAEALALLVEQQVEAGQAPKPAEMTALAAQLAETKGTPLGARLGHAYRLGLAATGDFAQAFRRKDLAPEAEAEVWRILAASGPDSEILAHAVLAAGQKLPDLPEATRRALAQRLLGLGLAGPAQRWLPEAPVIGGPVPEPQPEAGAEAPPADSPAWQEVTRLATSAPPEPAADGMDGALARSRALIAESAAARSQIEALLREAGSR